MSLFLGVLIFGCPSREVPLYTPPTSHVLHVYVVTSPAACELALYVSSSCTSGILVDRVYLSMIGC